MKIDAQGAISRTTLFTIQRNTWLREIIWPDVNKGEQNLHQHIKDMKTWKKIDFSCEWKKTRFFIDSRCMTECVPRHDGSFIESSNVMIHILSRWARGIFRNVIISSSSRQEEPSVYLSVFWWLACEFEGFSNFRRPRTRMESFKEPGRLREIYRVKESIENRF